MNNKKICNCGIVIRDHNHKRSKQHMTRIKNKKEEKVESDDENMFIITLPKEQ